MNFMEMYEASQKAYAKRTPKSADAYKEASKYMTGGETRSIVFFPPHPLTIEYGKGAYLYDLDGNRYIDFLNNYTSMIHGHANPAIMEAVSGVVDKGVCYGAAIPEQIELAKMLCERVPAFERVRFCNSGTEAVLFAIRAARAFTGKPGIIKMEGGFNGSCDVVEHSIAPKLPHADQTNPWKAYPDCSGIPANVSKDVYIAPYNNADVVEDILKAKSNEIAVIVLEPVLGQTGAIAARKEYLERLRKLADQYGVLLMFDEIQSFRLGYHGVQGINGVTPDLCTVGKFVGGGYPMAVFGGREDVMSVYDPHKEGFMSQSGTFNGNKLCVAAGIASLKLLDEAAIKRINGYAKMLADGIQSKANELKLPISVAHVGSMLHIHYTEKVPVDYVTAVSPYMNFRKILHMELLNRGIFIAPRGSMNMSTVMTEADIKEAIAAFDEVLTLMQPLFN